MNIHIILGGFLVALVSILGIVLIKSNKKLANYINNNLNIFTAVSAGVFLVTSYLLISESLEILSLQSAFISFAIGAIAYLLLHKILSPHRNEGDGHSHEYSKKSALKILIGDSIHNIADGLLLVASFGTSTALGYSTTLSVMLHEAPQEISEFFVLRKSGFTNTEALYRNVVTALSVFVGIALGLALINTESLEGYLLGATGVFFLGIIFTDLFPPKKTIQSKQNKKLFSALILGIIFMTGVTAAMGETHSHDHGSHNHGHHHSDYAELEKHDEHGHDSHNH